MPSKTRLILALDYYRCSSARQRHLQALASRRDVWHRKDRSACPTPLVIDQLPRFTPDPKPLLRGFSRSPRALAVAAGGLLVAAVAIVVLLALSDGSRSNYATLPQLQIGKIRLPAADSHRQSLQTIYTSDDEIFTDPVGVIREASALGFDRVKVNLAWSSVAPNAASPREPHFDASDPSAYPASRWGIYDRILRLCRQYHLRVDLALAPFVPRWAEGPGEPKPATQPATWNPNPRMFEQFAEAVGARYSGHYTPKGQKSPLPRVDFWSIWNEPNQGFLGISPQAIDHDKVESSPYHYRLLADAAWTALHRTGHGKDVTLLGEIAPIGATGGGQPGLFSKMMPLEFVRALYCVGANMRPLRGQAAVVRHCPSTAAASKRFVAQNPVLFQATAFSAHPYPQALPPDESVPGGGQDVVLATLPKLLTLLDRTQQIYGSKKRFNVYNTEYGYQTNPPDTQQGYVTPGKAAAWLNWSQYIAWRLPRVLSYDQYSFRDPPPVPNTPYTRFASGIVTYSGRKKPGWYAVRMPIWVPAAHESKGSRLEVWGQIGPAKEVAMSRRQPAEIQLRAGTRDWRTLRSVSTRTSNGYLDVQIHFPRSGAVRIRWTTPHGGAITSRTTHITVG